MTQGRAKPKSIRYVPFGAYDRLVGRLGELARDGSFATRRDALAMILGLHGLRVTEVRNLSIGDLEVIDERLSVATLKRGRPRTVKLGPGVMAAIVQWRRLIDAEPLLSTVTGRRVSVSHWQRFCREVTAELLGGVGLKFHALRHTAAMRGYQAWRDPLRVRKRLGHASLNSTMVYVDAWMDLEEDEAEAIGRKIAVVPALACAEPVERLKLFAG